MKTKSSASIPQAEKMKAFARDSFLRDLLVVTVTVLGFTALFIANLPAEFQQGIFSNLRVQLNGLGMGLTLYIIWVALFFAFKLWDPLIAGTGLSEYNQLIRVSLGVIAVLAIGALTLKLDVSRLYIFSTIASGTILLLLQRWMSRQWLNHQRADGRYLKQTGVLGTTKQISTILPFLEKNLDAGLLVTNAILLETDYSERNIRALTKLGLKVQPFRRDIFDTAMFSGLDTLLVYGGEQLPAEDVKRLTWSLEGTSVEVILAPGLVNFADNRITDLNIDGLHLLRVEVPRFEGFKYTLKRMADLGIGSILAILASPIMLATALVVKADDGGPVFFKQQRVGQNGKPFTMYKFRSMQVGAEKRHQELKQSVNKSPNRVLYKNPDDPRVTRAGKFLRRWSIDELPQLLNVLNGTMSLVGPRPPLPSEVEQYEPVTHRRLLVKPGITGLWQISGRASLDWETSIQLDIGYVENWSLIGDLLIIVKTVKTVFAKSGAY